MTSSAIHYGVSIILTLILTFIGKESMCHAVSIRALLSSEADDPYRIVIGEPLSLTCNPPNIEQDNSKVEWIKDGEYDNIIVSDDQYTVDNGNRTLLINSAQPDDAGTYECRTTSAQPLSKHFSAFFFKLENLPETTCVEQGGNLTLTCLAEGGPIPTVQWLKDGQKLNDSKYAYESNIHYVSNAVLSFDNVRGSDAGTYTCQVFHDMGDESTTTKVNVEDSCETFSPDHSGGSIVVIVIGIIVGVSIIVVAASITFCYITKKLCFQPQSSAKPNSYSPVNQGSAEEGKEMGNI